MISACIITRNEQDKLESCLKAIAECPFEIVVVDTGSEDDSVNIAKKYTDKVFYFKWCRDFSAARNYTSQKASNDMILMIDTDELLVWQDFKHLKVDSDKIGAIERVNIFERSGESQAVTERVGRLYDRRKFHYEGRIHEQLVSVDNTPARIYNVPLRFEHSGYDGPEAEVTKKADRNIELLLEEYRINPHDPYILYQLGKSFYMKQDYENAFIYFDKATYEEVDEHLEYVADLIVSYGYSLINTKRNEMALGLESLWDNFKNRAEYVFMMGLVYMNNMMFDKAVDTFMEAAGIPYSNTRGVNSYLAYYNAGVIKECLGKYEEAKVFYIKSGDYYKAKQRLSLLKG